jgi:tetratricopeptide (TPR) repeat protein
MATDSSSNPALEQLRTALNNNPDDVVTAAALGNLYYDSGNAALAIVYYSVALRIDPRLPDIWTDMGTMYWQNGDISLAERAYREAIRVSPGFGNAYLNLGLLYRDAKRNPAQASALWKDLVERFPKHSAAERARALLAETFLQIS